MCPMKSTSRVFSPLKRLGDAIVSLVGLVILSPLLLVVAVVVLLTSGRPVFFLQERIGLRRRAFRIIKFRTMTRDAERRTKGQWITAGSPYVRPTVPSQVVAYTAFQRRRLEVRPGITGWAQVNGRNSISWTERIMLDVWYIDRWTPWLDVRILLMTIGQVLRQRGVEDIPPPDNIAEEERR
jgi:sugar transferase EpsL